MTSQEVRSEIMFGNFTNDELYTLGEAIKYRRAQLARDVKRGMLPGDNVKFTNSKTGRTHFGTVTKVKIKFVTVRENNMLWNVPAHMLTAA